MLSELLVTFETADGGSLLLRTGLNAAKQTVHVNIQTCQLEHFRWPEQRTWPQGGTRTLAEGGH